MPRAAVHLMGGTRSSRSRRRYRRARRLRSDRRGVVAVIGTLLSLLVFFALFGIFLTQYLPLWMADNEAALVNGAASSFLSFKSGVDAQYSLGGPPTLGTPFTISSNGVPLLAQPTLASISFIPQTCPSPTNYTASFYAKGVTGAKASNYGQPVNPGFCVFENQTLSVGPGGSSQYTQRIASGVLQMVIPNRYYTAETFYYEDDGVIQSQSAGYQVMAFAPPFNVTRMGGNTTVTSSFLDLTGNSTSWIGQGSVEVYSHLLFSQEVTSNGVYVPASSSYTPFTYMFEIGTQYPCAWSAFLEAQLAGLPTSLYNTYLPGTTTASLPYTLSCVNPTGATTVLAVTFTSVNYATLFYAGAEVTLAVGGT